VDTPGRTDLADVIHGSRESWKKFRGELQSLGVLFRYEYLPVPFSNGVRGNIGYSEEEYALRRDDNLPPADVIWRILNPEAAAQHDLIVQAEEGRKAAGKIRWWKRHFLITCALGFAASLLALWAIITL